MGRDMSIWATFCVFIVRLVCAGVLSCVIILELMVGFAVIDLPPDAHSRARGDFEGGVGGLPKMTLIPRAEKAGRRLVVMDEDWTYIVYAPDEAGGRFAFPVPVSRYFQSDFASIPFPFNRMISPFGRHSEAAIVHDWLYAVGEPGQRKFSDMVFHDVMRMSRVSWLERNIMYASVRLGGAKAYGRENEWNEAFREPVVQASPTPACLIAKPTFNDFYSSAFEPWRERDPATFVPLFDLFSSADKDAALAHLPDEDFDKKALTSEQFKVDWESEVLHRHSAYQPIGFYRKAWIETMQRQICKDGLAYSYYRVLRRERLPLLLAAISYVRAHPEMGMTAEELTQQALLGYMAEKSIHLNEQPDPSPTEMAIYDVIMEDEAFAKARKDARERPVFYYSARRANGRTLTEAQEDFKKRQEE